MKTLLLTVLLLAAASISLSAKTAAQPAPTPAPAKAEQAKPGSAPAKGNPTVQSLITVADVEKVGGFTGIKQVIEGDSVKFSTHPYFYLSQDKLRELAKIMVSRF
jgi:hypothetical protein